MERALAAGSSDSEESRLSSGLSVDTLASLEQGLAFQAQRLQNLSERVSSLEAALQAQQGVDRRFENRLRVLEFFLRALQRLFREFLRAPTPQELA